ncbi:hypothetical protein [Streptomyces sp. NPDC088180]|uniref:hypothetical protein n=1 Tax=Streptomyces sp. NPDC088180 TaxID=3365837 RepID=UPI00381AC2A5
MEITLNSAYDRAMLVGPVVLALSETLNLFPEQAVLLAVALAQQDPAQSTVPSPSREADDIPSVVRLTDGQLDIVVRDLVQTHRPDSYRKLHARFRAAKYCAGEQRLRAAWARLNASQNTSSTLNPETA